MDSMETAKSLKADPGTEVPIESDPQSGSLMNNERPGVKLDKCVIIVGAGSAGSKSGITDLQSTQDHTDEGQESFEVVEKDPSNPEQYTSYILIPKKNKAPDFDTMISSLTAEEMKTKLKKLLQENVELQKTSEQNNPVMPQKYPVLSAARENADKTYVIEQQSEDSNQSKQGYTTFRLIKRDELADGKENANETHTAEYQTEYSLKPSTNGYTELQMIKVPTKSGAPSSYNSRAQASEMSKDRWPEQEKEIKILREWITCLEQRLNTPRQKSPPAIIIQSRNIPNTAPLVNSSFSDNLQQYRNMLEMLSEFHIKQGSYYTKVEERLKKSIGVIQGLENKPSNMIDPTEKQEMLASCKAKLWAEVQEMIKEMKELTEVQNLFQENLSNYDVLLTNMGNDSQAKVRAWKIKDILRSPLRNAAQGSSSTAQTTATGFKTGSDIETAKMGNNWPGEIRAWQISDISGRPLKNSAQGSSSTTRTTATGFNTGLYIDTW